MVGYLHPPPSADADTGLDLPQFCSSVAKQISRLSEGLLLRLSLSTSAACDFGHVRFGNG